MAFLCGRFLFNFSIHRAGAGEIVIKVATLAPQGSEYHKILQEMGARMAKSFQWPDCVPALSGWGDRG